MFASDMDISLATRLLSWARIFSKISIRRDIMLVIDSFRHRRNCEIPNDVWLKVNAVNGFISRKEAGLLYWIASTCSVLGPVIELGSYEGRSTAIFAFAGRDVRAVDAWSLDVSDISAYGQGDIVANDVFYRFQNNLRHLQIEQLVQVNRGLTCQVGKGWSEKGAVLFIDAGHIYEDVKEDLDVWTPHLQPKGILVMHDVIADGHLGVTRAASELLNSGWRVIASAGSIVAFTRKL